MLCLSSKFIVSPYLICHNLTPQIEALGMLLGAAAPAECVRPPASVAMVEGTFQLTAHMAAQVESFLKAQGLPAKALPSQQQGAAQQRLLVRREVGIVFGFRFYLCINLLSA